MTTQINFKNPKYVIPLLILPFVIGIAYVISTMVEEDDYKVNLEAKKELNSSLPDPHLKGDNLNKFEAFKEAFSREKELGLKGFNEEEKETEVKKEEANEELLFEEFEDSQLTQARENSKGEAEELRELQQKYFGSKEEGKEPKSKQLDEFKQHLALIDSLGRLSEDKSLSTEKKENIEQQQEIKKEKPLLIRKQNNKNANHFNTIYSEKKEQFISAIIDEVQTVKEGSRVRIRLMDDIFIGDNQLKKGSYLFGLVSGFSAQRILININSILLDQEIVKTQITIYDNDGIQGLYIPNSDFREILKNAGSISANQQVSIDTQNESSPFEKFMYGTLQDVYRATSSAVSRKIKENKAKLKYNTVVFLINEEDK